MWLLDSHEVWGYRFSNLRLIVIAAIALVSFILLVSNGSAEEAQGVMGPSDGAIVAKQLIGWCGFLFIISMLRGFVIAGITLAFTEYISHTANMKTLSVFARFLTKKEELLEAIQERMDNEGTGKKKR